MALGGIGGLAVGGVDDVLGKRFSGDGMKDLREIGVHALALAGSENDDVHGN
jgi:hypothetical protein